MQEWKTNVVQEQNAIPDYEKPKLLIEDLAAKMHALDREVKYLINKAKTYKPKSKPKAPKNKTTSKNETDKTTDTEDKPKDTTSGELKICFLSFV